MEPSTHRLGSDEATEWLPAIGSPESEKRGFLDICGRIVPGLLGGGLVVVVWVTTSTARPDPGETHGWLMFGCGDKVEKTCAAKIHERKKRERRPSCQVQVSFTQELP